MARIIEDTGNTHVIHEHTNEGSNNALGLIIGVVLLVLLAFLFLYYGLPMIRNTMTPQVNVPSQVDVNVNKTE